MREIRMLRAMWRELETGSRRLLHGHEGGNPGHSQGAAYGLPRQFPTLPAARGQPSPPQSWNHARSRAGATRAATQRGAVGRWRVMLEGLLVYKIIYNGLLGSG